MPLSRAPGKARTALDVMFNDPAIVSLIRDGESERIPYVVADGAADGMQTFSMALNSLVKQRIVAMEAAERTSDNPDALRMNLQGVFESRDRGGISQKGARFLDGTL